MQKYDIAVQKFVTARTAAEAKQGAIDLSKMAVFVFLSSGSCTRAHAKHSLHTS